MIFYIIVVFAVIIIAGFSILIIDLFFPKVTTYSIQENKLKDDLSVIVLSDLHGRRILMGQNKSIKKIKNCKPDFIVLAGDMITTREINNYASTADYLVELSKIAPVYYGMGNHEQRTFPVSSKYYKNGKNYFDHLKTYNNINILNNTSAVYWHKNNPIVIYGLTLPDEFYKKRDRKSFIEPELSDYICKPKEESFRFLIAHHPKYMKHYLTWGADYIFCGHYHGGIVRIPIVGGLISPEFHLLPDYSGGHYTFQNQHGIVSRGMGTHTFPIRFFNRSQMIHLKLIVE